MNQANAPLELARTPGGAFGGALDYKDKHHFNIYRSATAKLDEEQFGCDPNKFYEFIVCLKHRATSFEWTRGDGIMMIELVQGDGNKVSLLENYANVDLERLIEIEKEYMLLLERSSSEMYLASTAASGVSAGPIS